MLEHLLELGLLAVAAVLVAAPLLSRIERPRARVAATAVTLLLLTLGLRALPDRRALRPAVAAPDRPIVATRAAFAGAEACQACHPGEHASWRDTYHRTMTQRPSPAAVRGDFDGVSLVGPDGAAWALSRDGARFLAARADGPASEVVLVTGSHHMQVYWLPGMGPGVLAQLPFVWLIDDRRWVPRNAAFLRPPEVGHAPPSETGRWNLVCLRCHTTDPQAQPLGSLDAFETRVGELGISCEVCHGPGAEHAAKNRDPARRYELHLGGRVDPTIVNPKRLDALRSSQVCGQCHSINSEKSEADWREWVTRGFDYRPGDDLLATRAVMQPPLDPAADELSATILRMDPHFVEDRFWPDGQVRVTGRELNGLLRSPCFQTGELSCVTCHELHRAPDDARPPREWANDLLCVEASGDAKCASCHDEVAKQGQAHTKHSGSKVGCMDCHMPHTSYGLLKAIRSHEVTSPDVATDLATGRPNACNLCHLDRTLAWTAERLEGWFGTPAPAIAAETRDVAAGPLWLLTGDAGQRALVAWATGWAPAREAAGTWWLAPYLAHLLRQDPYDAVRLIAWRSLRSLPAADGVVLDPIAPAADRARAADAVLERWQSSPTESAPAGAAVLAPGGALDRARFDALGARRDDKRVDLIE